MRSHADQEEGQSVEQKRQAEQVYLLDETEEEPPDHRGPQVDTRYDVELVRGLAILARQEGDLIRVGRDDLPLEPLARMRRSKRAAVLTNASKKQYRCQSPILVCRSFFNPVGGT